MAKFKKENVVLQENDKGKQKELIAQGYKKVEEKDDNKTTKKASSK